jgi:hypothetical protein
MAKVNIYKEKVYTHQISPEAYKFFTDIINLHSIVKQLKPCQHEDEHWRGIPEVDSYCSKCGMDAFEVHDENENLWAEAEQIYFANR